MTPPPDPLAELQAEHKLHRERHHRVGGICGRDICRDAQLLALCDRLAAAAEEKAQRYLDRAHLMMQPCKCDPLWSGEELCNGGCDLAARLAVAERQRNQVTAALELLANGSPKEWMEYCTAHGLPLRSLDGHAVPDWWMRAIAHAALEAPPATEEST